MALNAAAALVSVVPSGLELPVLASPNGPLMARLAACQQASEVEVRRYRHPVLGGAAANTVVSGAPMSYSRKCTASWPAALRWTATSGDRLLPTKNLTSCAGAAVPVAGRLRLRSAEPR
jgi:hypothetical protein